MSGQFRKLTWPSRFGGWALILLAAGAVNASCAEPTVRFLAHVKGKPLVVEVTGLSQSDLDRLSQRPEPDWPALLAVRIGGAKSAMLGVYRIEKDRLRFESRFPPSLGSTYRADFDPTQAPLRAASKPITATLTVPKPPVVATTALVQVYPTRDRLPENQLKFYLHFSAPMSRGEAYEHIRLLDEKGKAIDSPFLELGEELWDTDAKRFTLLLHPGRIKRGLQLREDFGPVLEEGKRYTLEVDGKWLDAEGNPLKTGFRKSFSTEKALDTQPDPKNWTLALPAAGKTGELTVGFPNPLDHALLNRCIWVEDAAGKRVAGKIRISHEETRWHFAPEKPWPAGRYRLMVDAILEDLAGNSVAKPFEVNPGRPQSENGKAVWREFEVK